MMKFVCLRLAYCLSVLSMDCKLDLLKEMNKLSWSLTCNSPAFKLPSGHEFDKQSLFVY